MYYLPAYRYAFVGNHITELIVGSTDNQPLLETPGEVILISLFFFALLLSVVYPEFETWIHGDNIISPICQVFKLLHYIDVRNVYLEVMC